jgi:hypothetical protein
MPRPEPDATSVTVETPPRRRWVRRVVTTVLVAVYLLYLLIAGATIFDSPLRAEPWGWAAAIAILVGPGLVLVLMRLRHPRWKLAAGMLLLLVPARCGVDLWATSPPAVRELRRLALHVSPPGLRVTDGYGYWGSCYDVCTEWSGTLCAAAGRPVDSRAVRSSFRSHGIVLHRARSGWSGTDPSTGAQFDVGEPSDDETGRDCIDLRVEGDEQPVLPGPSVL